MVDRSTREYLDLGGAGLAQVDDHLTRKMIGRDLGALIHRLPPFFDLAESMRAMRRARIPSAATREAFVELAPRRRRPALP